ncbi:MAG: pyridoxamine 5'-phosphate oxidase [Acetobacteraceae bacterium]|nr:pyridoxamine 5'-phosphate oxidase [Acetobacteraceae bacterium]
MPDDSPIPSQAGRSGNPDHDPIARFAAWIAEAERAEPNDANAVCLATATPDGRPSARMVLLKGVDARGFVFYTNLESRKGAELQANPNAALCFHWKSLHRSVRVEGAVEPVSGEEADAYYASRARGSRIGAWASRQSRPLEGRWALEKAVAEYTLKFGLGEIPRPSFWSGFRLLPRRIEFWRDMPFRLHDRQVFHNEGQGDDASWRIEALYP